MRFRETHTPFVDVAVIGGGVSGLAAAHRFVELARQAGREPSLVVLERSARAGGPIRSETHGDTLIEAGPDQFVTFKPSALELGRRLGLEHELLRIDGSQAPMQVMHGGQPVALPAGLEFFVPARFGSCLRSPLFTRRGQARMALERFVRPERSGADESVASFVERRFGRELHERVVEPIIGGIFTADTRVLSAEMALPRLRALERTRGSLSRAARAAASRGEDRRSPGFVTLRGGLQRWVDRLVARLPAGSMHFRSAVTRIRRDHGLEGGGSGSWVLEVERRGELRAGLVILAVPAPAGAALLRSLDAELSRRLAALEYASCATVSLLYRRSAVQRKLEGFGFFAPADSGLDLLACSYVNAKFPERAPGDRWLFRTFHGGARQPRALELDDAALARLAHRSLAGVLEITGEPEAAHVYRFPQAMPQYAVGFRDDARVLDERLTGHAGLWLCGSATGAFGIPDCVSSGESAAARAWEQAAVHEERATARAISAG